jgi:hypothetical protein
MKYSEFIHGNFIDKIKDERYRNSIIDALTGGIREEFQEYFEMVMNYVIDEKIKLFNKDEFKGSLYDDDDDETLDLILPCIRRVFGKVFIDTPKIFTPDTTVSSVKGYKDDGRMELFQLNYNIDEFIDYLIDILPKSKMCLSQFENIDRSPKTLEIIVDNYIGGLIKKVLESNDIKQDIRDLKIKNLIND